MLPLLCVTEENLQDFLITSDFILHVEYNIEFLTFPYHFFCVVFKDKTPFSGHLD